MSNEVAIQQALMRADHALAQIEGLSSRLAVLEGIWRAVAPQAGSVAAAAAASAAPPPVPVGVPTVGATPAPPTGLAAVVGPWAGLLQTMLEAAAGDIVPALRSYVAAGQRPAGIVPPPPAPSPTPQPPRAPGAGFVRAYPQPPGAMPAAAAQPQPGQPVSEGELDWLKQEAAQSGEAIAVPPVVAASQTSQLPPGYQHPPGVVPTPAPFVPMPR